MGTENKRVRTKEVGFVGTNLAGPGGDLTLYNRLLAHKKATTMSVSLILRLALQDYLDRNETK